MTTRTCYRCNHVKPLESFAKRRVTDDGYTHLCLDCKRQRAKALRLARIERGATPPLELDLSLPRECTRCRVPKSLEQFPKNKKCLGGRTRTCRECTNTTSRDWLRDVGSKNPDFIKRRQRSQELDRAKRYGLSVEQIEQMYADCGGLCEVCKEPPSMFGGAANNLHIDHCHSTGKVRGMLCARCNLTLGRVFDSPSLLRALAAYLERSHND